MFLKPGFWWKMTLANICFIFITRKTLLIVEGGAKKPSYVKSSPQNFLIFSFKYFATLA